MTAKKPTRGANQGAAETDAASEPQVLRQNAPPPLCPYHNIACESNRSDPFFTRYYCPSPDCSYSQKVPRPRMAERVRKLEDDEGFSAR